MARITVEDCLKKVSNRFALIHLAAKRVRQLRSGAEPLISAKNSDNVIALREIAAGKVLMVKRPEQKEPIEEANEIEMQTLSEEIDDSEKASMEQMQEQTEVVEEPGETQVQAPFEEIDELGSEDSDQEAFDGEALEEENFDEVSEENMENPFTHMD